MLNGFCKALIYYVQLLFPSKCNHHLICVTPHIWYHVMYKYLFLGTLNFISCSLTTTIVLLCIYGSLISQYACLYRRQLFVWIYGCLISQYPPSSWTLILLNVRIYGSLISQYSLTSWTHIHIPHTTDVDPDIWEFNLPIFSDLLDGVYQV